jgi:methionyl-tRNA formyltransferase
VGYDATVCGVCDALAIPRFSSIHQEGFRLSLSGSDLLLCVHGREIVPAELIRLPRLAAVNVHPYLYKYKGADPVGRALRDKEWHASVGAHRMTAIVDSGEVLSEVFVDIQESECVEQIYNRLYPVYVQVIIGVLRELHDRT